MMKRVLTTTDPADVRTVLDQIPYSGACFTNSLHRGTYTTHYTIRAGAHSIEAARVTEKYTPDGVVYVVRIAQ